MIVSPYETKYTREKREGINNPKRDMENHKPRRNKAQKARAKEKARKCEDGAYRAYGV